MVRLMMADVYELLLSSLSHIMILSCVLWVGMADVLLVWMVINVLLVQFVSNACHRGEGGIPGFGWNRCCDGR
jgi:hypothetical protein